MSHATRFPGSTLGTSSHDALDELLREGARRLLASAIEAEVESYLAQTADLRDEKGHRLVVRNGYLPERKIQTGIGPISVRRPRVEDRRPLEEGHGNRFSSKLVPPYVRKTASLEAAIPWLYLRGISTGDLSEALGALLGKEASGLSASTVVRLKQIWDEEYDGWRRRRLEKKNYVYLWVDGIYLNVRLEDARPCVLVVLGATEDGKKELLAVEDGERESEQSWYDLLIDLKKRGLSEEPRLAVGDGALGFWKALPKVFPKTKPQRCWVHKTANVLNALPKSQQGRGKKALQDIWMAATKSDAEKAYAAFIQSFEAKYPKATECLEKDKDRLLAFYDFPAEHWVHIRTTNPIESTFASVRLRTDKTKGAGSRVAALTMVFKLVQAAEQHWRMLNAVGRLKELVEGATFKDGVRVAA
jgi:transposase-like protein